MKDSEVVGHMRVRVGALHSTLGYMVGDRYLRARREGATGVVGGYVPGHGGDVWWVFHDDGAAVGVYRHDELEPLPDNEVAAYAAAHGAKGIERFRAYLSTALKDFGDDYSVTLMALKQEGEGKIDCAGPMVAVEIDGADLGELIRALQAHRARGDRLVGMRRRNKTERKEHYGA